MKRVLAVLFVLALLLCMVACGGSQSGDALQNGNTYIFQNDKFHAYKAVALSDTTVKIEVWYRSMAGVFAEPFTYSKDFAVIDTKDSAYSFKWLDAGHTAFSITIADEDNSRWDEEKEACFVKNDDFPNSIAAKADRVYTCLNDKWDKYVAVEIADNVVKIENWYTSQAGETGDPHMYYYDVLTVNTEDGSSDFAWLDDAHSAFSITMADAENSRLEEPTKLMFAYDAAFEVPDPDPSTRMGALNWPGSGLATMLPTPKADVGKINEDMASSFDAYVAHITEDQFNAYADECVAMGYTEETIRDEDYFWAYNEAGARLEIRYLPYSIMQVDIFLPSD